MKGYEEIQESIVRIAAEINGPHSSAALALKNADERRAAGQTVKFYLGKGSILVQGTTAQKGAQDNG